MAVSLTGSARSAANITLRLTPRLSRWIQTQMTDDIDHDLSLRQLSALQYIDGTETTLGDVARSLNVTPAVVTGLIDRLERRGYVRRVASTFDRRRVHIELTTAGEDVREQAEFQLAARLETLISTLSQDEIDTLEDGLRVLDKAISSIAPRRGKTAAPKSGFDS
jgi:DNA-binding MarR family transcriptional regulator